MYFAIGDYAAAMLVAVLTVAGVRAVVWPGMDMVVAMFLGMALGMGIAMLLGLLLAPLLGMFQTMVPGMLIGMWGGMLFAMRDAMGAGSPSPGVAAAVGALFGAVLLLGIKTYGRILQGTVGE
ncbi:MAG: hypothetical protein JRS35_14415 [Deltaproteobacteria bacterium]|nr:hypothetical protein [Deltaproteobacteria bacterium]